MAVLNIRKIGDPVLRSKSKGIEQITENTLKLIDDMTETMYKNDGVGLAAPQVGVLMRIIVIDTGENDLYQVINPVVVDCQGEELREEACLSIPGENGVVPRAKIVTVEGLNREGEKISLKAEGLLARVFQHEIDHLDGGLFIDKVVKIDETDEVVE